MEQPVRTIGVYAGVGRYLTLDQLCPYPERGTFFMHLIREGSKRNIVFLFGDEADLHHLDAELHIDFQFRNRNPNTYLIQFETFNVNPKNIFIGTPLAKKYSGVFSWQNWKLRWGKGPHIYSEIPYNNPVVSDFETNVFRDIKYSMVATNRNLNLPTMSNLNGYKLRQDVIKYFVNHWPGRLSVYGRDWDMSFALPVLQKLQRKFGKKKNVAHRYFYKGEAQSKFNVLFDSEFNICFENKLHVDGYYTEKIFDALVCGSIPIYCGTRTLDAIVPKDCYVDLRDYNSLSEMVEFCESLTAVDKKNYRIRIRNFAHSFDWHKISEITYVNRVLDFIENDASARVD